MIRFARELFMIMLEEDSGGGGGSLSTDNAPADTATDTAAETGATETTEGFEPHPYMAQARGDYKKDEFFKDYTDITSVMSALKENSEKLNEYEKKAAESVESAPKKADDYKMLDKTQLDGIDLKKEEVEALRESALGISATQEQFEAMAKNMAEQKKAQNAFLEERREASLKMLQKEWPTKEQYKQGWERYSKAVAGLEKAGIPGINEMFKNPNYGDNAVLIRIMSEFGRFFEDDSLLDGNGIPGDKGTPGQLSYKDL